MSENNVNVPLLRKAVEWAEAEALKPPELSEWVQGMWVTPTPGSAYALTDWVETTEEIGKSADCGTCYCIAGYVAAEVVGAPMRNDDDADQAPSIAAEALGIESSQGNEFGHLFYFGNTIQDVRRIAEGLAGERL